MVSQSGNTAVVNASGVYSVTVTNTATGCSSTTSITISQDNTAPSVSIVANPSLTITQGQTATLTAQGASSYSWSTGDNTASIIVSTAGTYSVTGTAANRCTATASVTLTVNPVASGPFAITGVTTVSCTPILPGRFSLSFTPRYSGLTGQPISFSVANELRPTTLDGPYTLQVYTDNPRIVLQATQTGTPTPTSFVYEWLAACMSSEAPNTPPQLVTPIPDQTATVGQPFSYVIPEGTFTDSESPGSLVLSARGLPPGLRFAGATLSGTPSVSGVSSLTITATDPGGLTGSTSFMLRVNPAPVVLPPDPTAVFSLTGVTTLSCTPVANRINIIFAPRYAGLNGQPIAFEAVNEFRPTTDAAPYALTLYRDNPVILLRATQTGSAAPTEFSYRWLEACMALGRDNTAPIVTRAVGAQTALVGVSYSLGIGQYFTDQETPDGLSYGAVGLPAGLSLTGSTITGVPSSSGVSSVTLSATDPSGLSVSTSFTLTVRPADAPQPPTPTNTAPVVANAVSPQSATVGVGYSLNLSAVFTDAETPNSLVLSASGLPAGLSLSGMSITGTPSMSGVSNVSLVATDPGGLTASTGFTLTVSPASSQTVSPPPSGSFAITGVQTLSCVVVSGGERMVSFAPQYSGVNGQPISFSVVNEMPCHHRCGSIQSASVHR